MRRVGWLVIALSLMLACSSSTGKQGAGTGGSAGTSAAGAGGNACTSGSAGRGGGAAGTGVDAGAGTSGTDASAPGTLVWRNVTVPGIETHGEVKTIWGTGSELYVGDDYRWIYHRSAAGTWSSQQLESRWLWGSGPTNVYVSGGGKLFHSTGDDVWTEVSLPSPPDSLIAIWGPSANEVFVAAAFASSATGGIFHLRAGTWTLEPIDPVMRYVYGTSATDVWAVGGDGETLYWSNGNGTWVHKGVGSGEPLTAVWSSGPNDAYVVVSPYNMTMGNAYVSHQQPDGSFHLEHGAYIEELLTVWGSGPHDVYVAGRTLTGSFDTDRARLYHSTGDGQWTAVEVPGQLGVTRIDVVWGSSATDVYLGGYSNANNVGVVLHGTPN